MKLYFVSFLFSTCTTFGQTLLDTQSYIDNKQISKTAKDLYCDKFTPKDDTSTFSIIDSLNTKNNLTRPFYILLVSKMLKKADGALSESLGVSCKAFVETHPDFLIDFLYSKKLVADKSYFDNWANQIANEFLVDCEERKAQCLKESKEKSLTKTKLANKSRLKAFYDKIECYCH